MEDLNRILNIIEDKKEKLEEGDYIKVMNNLKILYEESKKQKIKVIITKCVCESDIDFCIPIYSCKNRELFIKDYPPLGILIGLSYPKDFVFETEFSNSMSLMECKTRISFLIKLLDVIGVKMIVNSVIMNTMLKCKEAFNNDKLVIIFYKKLLFLGNYDKVPREKWKELINPLILEVMKKKFSENEIQKKFPILRLLNGETSEITFEKSEETQEMLEMHVFYLDNLDKDIDTQSIIYVNLSNFTGSHLSNKKYLIDHFEKRYSIRVPVEKWIEN